jgi:phosphate/sulfate permease
MENPKADVMEEPKEMKTEDSILKVAWDFFADNTYRQDLHEISLGESKRAAAIWEKSTEYDLKSERLFQYLQVFTACMASFAHGANDVANAIAPVSGILYIYKNGDFATKAEVNKGILAMGGAAIGLGFTFFGYRIVKAVAFKLTKMSPSRGFCIELAGKNSQ